MHDKDNMTTSKLVCQINWSGTALQFWLSVFRRLSYNHRFINKRILATKKAFRREKTRLTSPAVRAAATSKAWRDSGRTSFSPSQSTWRHEEALLEEFYPGGEGELPMMAYTGRLRLKEVYFQASGIWKGRDFNSWSIWKGREIRLSFGSVKGPKRGNRWILRLYKAEKTFYFCDWFLFKRQCIKSI